MAALSLEIPQSPLAALLQAGKRGQCQRKPIHLCVSALPTIIFGWAFQGTGRDLLSMRRQTSWNRLTVSHLLLKWGHRLHGPRSKPDCSDLKGKMWTRAYTTMMVSMSHTLFPPSRDGPLGPAPYRGSVRPEYVWSLSYRQTAYSVLSLWLSTL